MSVCNFTHADWFNFGFKSKTTQVQNTQDPETAVKGLSQNQDDVYSDQNIDDVKLTPEQKHEAVVWGLTQNEEKRYLLLMQNRSGNYWSQHQLTPVEILGINARDPKERAHFADLYAAQLQQRVGKELAWMVSATKAKKSLNKGTPVVQSFDVKPYSPYYQGNSLQAGDSLFLFTTINTESHHVTSTLLNQLEKTNFTVNIYFVDKPSNKAVQAWASSQNIPYNLVQKGTITLNTNAGHFDEIQGDKTLPVMVVVRNGRSERVDLSRLS